MKYRIIYMYIYIICIKEPKSYVWRESCKVLQQEESQRSTRRYLPTLKGNKANNNYYYYYYYEQYFIIIFLVPFF